LLPLMSILIFNVACDGSCLWCQCWFSMSNSAHDAFFIFNAACDASFNLLSKCHCPVMPLFYCQCCLWCQFWLFLSRCPYLWCLRSIELCCLWCQFWLFLCKFRYICNWDKLGCLVTYCQCCCSTVLLIYYLCPHQSHICNWDKLGCLVTYCQCCALCPTHLLLMSSPVTYMQLR
jgi:hypothetical protein